MRIFLGIDLPKKLQHQIETSIKPLKRRYKDIKWIEKEKYHLTLLFLGEVNPQKLPKIKSRIEKAIFNINPFFIFSSHLDVFPRKKMIIHLGFKRSKELENLVKALQSEMQDYLRNRPQRRFTPHVTLSRARLPAKQQYFVFKKLLHKTQIPFELRVEKIHIYSSTLTAHGAIYKKITSIKLKEQP